MSLNMHNNDESPVLIMYFVANRTIDWFEKRDRELAGLQMGDPPCLTWPDTQIELSTLISESKMPVIRTVYRGVWHFYCLMTDAF